MFALGCAAATACCHQFGLIVVTVLITVMSEVMSSLMVVALFGWTRLDDFCGSGSFSLRKLRPTRKRPVPGLLRNNNRNANNGNGQSQKQSREANTMKTEQDEREQYSNNEYIPLVNLIASRVYYDFCRDNFTGVPMPSTHQQKAVPSMNSSDDGTVAVDAVPLLLVVVGVSEDAGGDDGLFPGSVGAEADRKMMEISSMRLLLNVQVTTLEGRMYAFRTSPRILVRPCHRSVELSLVSEWIKNKLQLILEKNLVLPNMDDVIIPVCSGNKLLEGGLNR
ncbi:hypothetical protein niasHS_010270 [Heterodera schachtii]|uniref:Uncharacterized protein n=1 Tax=Heterodera schachtii TaxID=97005 RepID=A0ABD2J100_HETSC